MANSWDINIAATAVVEELAGEDSTMVPCMRELSECMAKLREHGATDLPTWAEAAQGAQPPPLEEGIDAADLDRGWQCHTSSFLENTFLEQVVVANSDPSRQALLLSQASGPACAWLRAIPSEPAFTMAPLRLQVAIRRRLRWPLPLSGGPCCRGCGHNLDPLGDRAAACSRSGRLKLRSRPVEKMWARILREGGGRVRENVFLRDTALDNIDPNDGRRIEVVVSGLPIARGIPIAVDATLVSPLHADGTPHPHTVTRPGASFRRAEASKANTYPELVNSSLLQLLTVASKRDWRETQQAWLQTIGRCCRCAGTR